jgi:hypothetical protein
VLACSILSVQIMNYHIADIAGAEERHGLLKLVDVEHD